MERSGGTLVLQFVPPLPWRAGGTNCARRSAPARNAAPGFFPRGNPARDPPQVGVPPPAFEFACANSPRTAGAARTLAGILGTSQNSGKHKSNRREFGQAAPARFKNIGLGPMFSKRTAAGRRNPRRLLSQPSRTVASYRNE